ncbi:MAG TPA: protease pro-enzyme activation domain-containing protein, partial [Chthoniobacteraceae bacterium]|nr:protease pro-enzyme activation domain-containing protein [Chthoniobacteraceae bacterium]
MNQLPNRTASRMVRGLLAAALLGTHAYAQVLLPGSVKLVKAAPNGIPSNAHEPQITRATLTAAEGGAPIHFEVALKMRNFAGLEARIARGERISQKEMAEKYEPLPRDYAAVTAWLTGQGLKITRADRHHMAIFATGKVSEVRQALKVTFERVSLEGEEYTSAVTAPSVPASVAPLLVGINGLQPHIKKHRHLIRKQAVPNASGGQPPYYPSQLAAAYDINPLSTNGINGAGQTIAIVIDTFPNASDLKSFWAETGVKQSINNIQFIQAIAGTLPAPSGEETLDTEWSSSMAPGAKVRVYAAAELLDNNLDETYLKVYDDVIDNPSLNINQMSMSYGIGETYTTSSQVYTDDQYFAELAAAGVTIFASAGDSGSTPGDGPAGDEKGSLQACSPATDPNVTGVGGTSLILDANNNETSETVWNDSPDGGAGGGGVSIYFPQPAWQTGAGVSGTARECPDIAAAADPDYGALIVLDGESQQIGGTSWSSPTWAGMCALINQARIGAGESSIGLLGPKIYPLLSGSNYPGTYNTTYRDITSGNNATANSSGNYPATVGYDCCSGLGAPLLGNVVPLLVDSGIVGISTPAQVEQVVPGEDATYTVTVTGAEASYQWQRMPIGQTTWTNLSDAGSYSGSRDNSLTIADTTTAMSGDQFQCLITYGTNSATTNPASILIVDTPLQVTTLAGSAQTMGRVNGTGSNAQFNNPSGVAVDGSGNAYVADYTNNEIRMITPGGVVTTPYGSTLGYSGSANGTGNSATFNNPDGIAIDGSNNIYVADAGNNLIRKISGGSVSTLAGGGGQFNVPVGVAVDAAGNVYVADSGNDVIRMVTPGGTVSTLAGNAGQAGYQDGAATTAALFKDPTGVAVDSEGNVFVADCGNAVVREISNGVVSTVAGQAGNSGYLDGLGTNALFNAPAGLAIDGSNNIYIADALLPGGGSIGSGNDLVRKLSPAGVVSTLAGEVGISGSDDGTGAGAQFYGLQGLAVSGSGAVLIADTHNGTIREGAPNATVVIPNTSVIVLSGNMAFGNVAASETGTAQLTITNAGSIDMAVSGISYPLGYAGDWSAGIIAAQSSQTVNVTFSPHSPEAYDGTITVTSNATTGVNTIGISGTGVTALMDPAVSTISATGLGAETVTLSGLVNPEGSTTT